MLTDFEIQLSIKQSKQTGSFTYNNIRNIDISASIMETLKLVSKLFLLSTCATFGLFSIVDQTANRMARASTVSNTPFESSRNTPSTNITEGTAPPVDDDLVTLDDQNADLMSTNNAHRHQRPHPKEVPRSHSEFMDQLLEFSKDCDPSDQAMIGVGRNEPDKLIIFNNNQKLTNRKARRVNAKQSRRTYKNHGDNYRNYEDNYHADCGKNICGDTNQKLLGRAFSTSFWNQIRNDSTILALSSDQIYSNFGITQTLSNSAYRCGAPFAGGIIGDGKKWGITVLPPSPA
jgi:hypothetical protein